ncbi:MAG: hypothetical protein LBD82_01565 [Deltaproteobacteria bacterium]|jgi:predicted Zn-dependent protease|nr:hypothetical protein [Deltaproteobacteria bacterium]
MPDIQREQIESLEILGHVYFMQGRPREAGLVFHGLLSLKQDNFCALKHLAALALERGDGAEALRHLEKCAAVLDKERDPMPPPLLLMRAKALRLAGREGEARQAMSEYLNACGLSGATKQGE